MCNLGPQTLHIWLEKGKLEVTIVLGLPLMPWTQLLGDCDERTELPVNINKSYGNNWRLTP